MMSLPSNCLTVREDIVKGKFGVYFDQCTWALFGKDGKNKLVQPNSYCFGDLKLNNYKGVEWFYVWTSPIKKIDYDFSLTLSLDYYHWLLNDSVWSDAFYTKDAEEFYNIGGFLYGNLPSSHVMQAAVLTRYLFERTSHVKSFLTFKQHIPYMWAWLIAHFIVKEHDKYIIQQPINLFHIPFFLNQLYLQPQIMYNIIYNFRQNWEGVPPFNKGTDYPNLCSHWYFNIDTLYPRYSGNLHSQPFPIIFPKLNTMNIGFAETAYFFEEKDLAKVLDEIVSRNSP